MEQTEKKVMVTDQEDTTKVGGSINDWIAGITAKAKDDAKKEAQTLPFLPTQEEMDVYKTMSQIAVGSKFYEKLGGPDGILAIMLLAREIKIPPMQAITGGIYFADKVGLIISAATVNQKIREAGHLLKITESTNTKCAIWGERKDTGEEYTASFTIEDARLAGLIDRNVLYKKIPGQMLFAKAMALLGRRLFPDVTRGAYVEGEDTWIDNQNTEPKATITKSTTLKAMAEQAKTKPKLEPVKTEPPKVQEPATPTEAKTETPVNQPETPSAAQPVNNQQKKNIILMLVNKTSTHFEGDVSKINYFFDSVLPGADMENLDNFEMAQLREVLGKVKALKE